MLILRPCGVRGAAFVARGRPNAVFGMMGAHSLCALCTLCGTVCAVYVVWQGCGLWSMWCDRGVVCGLCGVAGVRSMWCDRGAKPAARRLGCFGGGQCSAVRGQTGKRRGVWGCHSFPLWLLLRARVYACPC